MEITGWGRYPRIQARVRSFDDAAGLVKCLEEDPPLIARGLGRSYGDPALSPLVITSERARRFLDFGEESGLLTCQAGVSLAEIVATFLPRGWFLPVTPGTKYVTVGGAIAADVHGKNHHVAGCFTNWVRSFDLMLPDGSTKTCSPDENSELYRATCGGMGLTGVITQASIQLAPAPSAYIDEKIIPAPNLAAILELFEEHKATEYSVAWIDSLARGKDMGRSVLMLGRFANYGGYEPKTPKRRAVPFEMPGFLLNKISVSLFNRVYYGAAGKAKQRRIPFEPFFYPLDAIDDWNRMYGKSGFTQYQFVLPKEAGTEGLGAVLDKAAASGQGSFLTVLKLLGPANANYLSFPMEGYTLALDFKIQPKLFPLLDELDRMVLDYGGRLYLAKDVRMAPSMMAGYPLLDQFRKVRDMWGMKGRFESLQSFRLGL